MKRRTFIKLAGAGGVGLAAIGPAGAADTERQKNAFGILIDLTACAGCRTCEFVCAESNGLPEPAEDEEWEARRSTSEKQWTVLDRAETEQGEVFLKKQCMHCLEPACAAACLTRALIKTEEGPVVWRSDKCMGCRYCMISCPFDVPKFEYHSANPRIQKCRMCWERIVDGEVPVCVENCPNEALMFGRRGELLEVARQRIYQNPGHYVPEIYGEHEVGGTSVLYISPVPFEELGFKTDLGETAYPEYTRDFLTAVPFVLTLWPMFLTGLRRAAGEDQATETAAEELHSLEERG